MPDGDVTSHQIEKPRVSRVSKSPAPPAGAPSIEALTRHWLACRAAHRDLHKLQSPHAIHTVAHGRYGNAMDVIDERDNSLRDLVGALPSRTLADAFVQIALMQEILDQHVDRDVKDDALDLDDLAVILKDLKKVFRLAVSIFPVVVAASGTDPAGLVDEWQVGRWDQYFGPIAETMGGAS